ncbi:DUF3793 family protein [Caproicibacterium sp. NSD3]
MIRYCFPTLVGIKTGNLFSCFDSSQDKIFGTVRKWNQHLVPKGLRVLPLYFSEKHALIYLAQTIKKGSFKK